MKVARILALVLLAVRTAAAQTGAVALKSPDGALEISIATVRGPSVEAAGGKLAYRVTFRGRAVIEWSNLGLLLEGAPAIAVPLSYLGSGAYDAEIYSDGPNAAAEPTDSVVEKRRVDARTVLQLKLAPAGGSAIRLVPVR